MLSEEHFSDLENKGYTVVENVVNEQECDKAVAEYKSWINTFGDKWPNNFHSVIDKYNVGHLDPTWRIRLKTKSVFAQIWKTEKLLTSFDAISIGRPPEDGVEEFQVPGKYWLHADLTPSRIGLHAYQGALYLEEQTESDWTFQVIEGSHKFVHQIFDNNPKKAETARMAGHYYDLEADDIEFFEAEGFQTRRVPVPKGGMALWDSRLVHANARPLPNRKNAGRWRYVVFVSMTPAIWANELDIQKRKEAYVAPSLTSHWSSQGVIVWPADTSTDIPCQTTLPDIARSEEAMKLSGVLPYDFEDGQSNGDSYRPLWRRDEHGLSQELDKEKLWANGHI